MAEAEKPDAADQPPEADQTDTSLLRRLQHGNQDAATQLYFRYAERLRLLIRSQISSELNRRLEIDDIIQSVFRSFFRGFKRGFYDVPTGDTLWKLLLVIALNKIRAKGTFHRAAKRDVRLTVGSNFLEALSVLEQEPDRTAYSILQMVIEEVLKGLTPLHQRMIHLRIEGHEVAEIAAQTGRSKRTVERVLQDFRKTLADILREED